MKRLLNIEWNKIFYYKSARIFTILYFLMLAAVGVVLAYIKPEIGGIELDIAQLGFFNFPDIWQNIAYVVAIGKIFLGVIVIMNVTNEFSNGTLKQNLIDGLSKKEFLQSKLLTNFIFAAVSTLFVFAISLILGFVFSNSQDAVFRGVEFIGAYFIKLAFFFSFCLFMGGGEMQFPDWLSTAEVTERWGRLPRPSHNCACTAASRASRTRGTTRLTMAADVAERKKACRPDGLQA